jgi:hypothetical protein
MEQRTEESDFGLGGGTLIYADLRDNAQCDGCVHGHSLHRLEIGGHCILEIRFHGPGKNEASAAADANSFFRAAFGHLFIRMNSIGFDCRRMLLVKRGQKLRCSPEVQNCGREQTWRRYTEVVRDAKMETPV